MSWRLQKTRRSATGRPSWSSNRPAAEADGASGMTTSRAMATTSTNATSDPETSLAPNAIRWDTRSARNFPSASAFRDDVAEASVFDHRDPRAWHPFPGRAVDDPALDLRPPFRLGNPEVADDLVAALEGDLDGFRPGRADQRIRVGRDAEPEMPLDVGRRLACGPRRGRRGRRLAGRGGRDTRIAGRAERDDLSRGGAAIRADRHRPPDEPQPGQAKSTPTAGRPGRTLTPDRSRADHSGSSSNTV